LVGDDNWTDPSENVLNDFMAFGAGALRGLAGNTVRSAVSSGAEWSPTLL